MGATRIATLLAIIGLTSTGVARAQHEPSPTAGVRAPERTRGVCLRPGPRPSCRSFVLTQARLLYRLFPETATATRWYLTADLGWMRNVSERDALGVSVFGGPEFGFEQVHYGMRARYRRWLGERTSLDVSMGVVLGTEWNVGKPGFSGVIDFTLSDLVSLSAGLDYATRTSCELVPSTAGRQCGSEYGGRGYLGVAAGSQLGIAAYGVAGLLGLLAALYSP